MENRNNNRYKTDQSIVCSVFTSHSPNDLFDGKIKNYCDFGVYAEIPTHFKVGTVLLVRATSRASERLPAKIGEGFRSVSLAEVKWSKPVSANGTVCYGTGLKHLAIW
jgi:hypothetical protein